MILHPNNLFGQILGGLALLALGLLLAYPLYRAQMAKRRFKYGAARAWHAAHLWLGVGFFALVFLHSGFRLPNDWLTGMLFYAGLFMTLTGGAWWAAQKFLAQSLGALAMQNAGKQVLFERMPEFHAHLLESGATYANGRAGYFEKLYREHWLPGMAGLKFSWKHLLQAPRDKLSPRLQAFSSVLTEEEREAWRELHKWYMAKLHLDASYSMQLVLKKFHLIHGLLAFVLLALALAHVLSVGVF